jgi:hypothetical protein
MSPSGRVGPRRPEVGITSSHGASPRSSNFPKENSNLDFYVKSRPLNTHNWFNIWKNPVQATQNISDHSQSIEDSFVNFALNFGLSSFCLLLPQWDVPARVSSLSKRTLHCNVCQLTLTSKWSDTESRQGNVWFLSLSLLACLKCFYQTLVLESPNFFW